MEMIIEEPLGGVENQDATELANSLFELLKLQWDMQTKNYNLEDNYVELLPEILLQGRDLTEITQELTDIKQCCQNVLGTQRPEKEPRYESPFMNNEIAPVPNNPVINVFLQALLHGGKDACRLDGGWEKRGNMLFYEAEIRSGGSISVSLKDGSNLSIEESWKIVKSLTLFTADVAIGILACICRNYSDNNNNYPVGQETDVSSVMLLRGKKIKSYGRQSWGLKEAICNEVEKIEKLQVKIEGLKKPGKRTEETISTQTFSILSSEIVYRIYNKYEFKYIPTVWRFRPGDWANIWMSAKEVEFIGKLHKSIFELEHKDQRPADQMAKKLAYMFFTVPGGTYYLENGVNKSVKIFLKSIGEYIEDRHRKTWEIGRKIERLCKGLDKLSDIGVINLVTHSKTLISRKSHSSRKTLSETVKISLQENSGIAPTRKQINRKT